MGLNDNGKNDVRLKSCHLKSYLTESLKWHFLKGRSQYGSGSQNILCWVR